MPLGIPAPNRTGACGQPPPCRFSGAIGLGVLGQPSASIADAGAAPVTFAEVKQNVDKRCHVCHSAERPAPGVAEAGSWIEAGSKLNLITTDV